MKHYPQDRSPWTFLGAEIEALMANHSGDDISSSQLIAVMTVAIEPATLKIALGDTVARPLADAYAAALCANADMAAAIFKTVRDRWHNPNPSDSDIVWRFIATNAWAPVVKDNGKVRLDILAHHFSDEELSRAIVKGGGRPINATSIKVIRGRMRLPKARLKVSTEFHAALHRLRDLGFCQHW